MLIPTTAVAWIAMFLQRTLQNADGKNLPRIDQLALQ
jgi:hypothetical protein